MRAAAQHRWGKPSLAGRTVGVAGVGKVGSWLVDRLVEDGADVVVTDVDAGAVERVLARHPAVDAVADTASLVRTPTDVYAPCALRRALDDGTVAVLEAEIVCGGAHNQPGDAGIAAEPLRRGVLSAPGYLG